MKRHTIIFLGPTLSREVASHYLEAEYRPPIKRGDLDTLLPEQQVIGIIDGLFLQSLSISSKEILRYLERGGTVFGSSSMGALRATELAPFGMKGIGTVYQWYHTGYIDADDEVAMIHTDEDWRPLSEPMVNIRIALLEALQEGIVTPEEKRFLLRSAKSCYFPERSYPRLLQIAANKMSDQTIQALQKKFQQARNIKREDALLLLSTISHYISEDTLYSSTKGEFNGR